MAKFEDVYRKMVQEQANPEAAETEVISEEVIAEGVDDKVVDTGDAVVTGKEKKKSYDAGVKKAAEPKATKVKEVKEDDDEYEDDEDEKKKDDEKVEKKESVKKEKVEVKETETEKKETAHDIPKTKNGILKAVYGKMEGIKKEHLAQAYNAILASFDKIKEDGNNGDAEKKKVDVDVKEHMSALFHGEEELSEGFREKAEVIFEAAVRSKIDSEIDRLEAEYSTELNDSIESAKEELTEKVDQYLDYVVSEWMKDNELAVDRGVKTELTEDFIKGMKQLFADHYIEVPENKEDVLSGFAEKCSDLEGKLNEQIKKNAEMKQQINESRKTEILREVSSGLAETEVEKLKGLSKGIEYESDAQYQEQLTTVKENYFPKQAVMATDEVEETGGNDGETELPSSMARYTKSIKSMTTQNIYGSN